MSTEQPANQQLGDLLPQHQTALSALSGNPPADDATRVLLERIRQGDEEARNDLFRRYLLPVLFLVRINLGRGLRIKVESWDIVQEVFIKCLRGLDSFHYEHDGAFRLLQRLTT